jgi:hypothetical protein
MLLLSAFLMSNEQYTAADEMLEERAQMSLTRWEAPRETLSAKTKLIDHTAKTSLPHAFEMLMTDYKEQVDAVRARPAWDDYGLRCRGGSKELLRHSDQCTNSAACLRDCSWCPQKR